MTHLKVSILVREWALGRWEEGEQVSLAEELPALQGNEFIMDARRLQNSPVAFSTYPGRGPQLKTTIESVTSKQQIWNQCKRWVCTCCRLPESTVFPSSSVSH
jgi:hypothetical protein